MPDILVLYQVVLQHHANFFFLFEMHRQLVHIPERAPDHYAAMFRQFADHLLKFDIQTEAITKADKVF